MSALNWRRKYEGHCLRPSATEHRQGWIESCLNDCGLASKECCRWIVLRMFAWLRTSIRPWKRPHYLQESPSGAWLADDEAMIIDIDLMKLPKAVKLQAPTWQVRLPAPKAIRQNCYWKGTVTWEWITVLSRHISFDQIKKQLPAAADLLRTVNRHEIPTMIMTRGFPTRSRG